MSAHAALRAATRDAHERVDESYSRFDLSDRDQYRDFLTMHAAAFLPAEQALTSAGMGHLIADWPDMVRSPALESDLAELGQPLPRMMQGIDYPDRASILGGAYVLEGSRLGGAMLRKRVGAGLPRRFLDCVQPPGRWRAFVAVLERDLYDSQALNRAVAAALTTFALFEQVELDEISE